MSKRAAIYSRVSTEDQAKEGYSLPDQERRCLAHIERQGWALAGKFQDAGVSGAVPMDERPNGSKLIERLPELDVIVTIGLDRLGRSQRDLSNLFERLSGEEVEIASLREPHLDGSTASSRLFRGMLAQFAEY